MKVNTAPLEEVLAQTGDSMLCKWEKELDRKRPEPEPVR
jgi:hypothetical protein